MNASKWRLVRASLVELMSPTDALRFRKCGSFFPGAVSYVWEGRDRWFFLCFHKSSLYDAYFIEFAWSRDRVWPPFPTIEADLKCLNSGGSVRVRLDQLCMKPPYKANAWCLKAPLGLRPIDSTIDIQSEDAISSDQIVSVVALSVSAIKSYVLPVIRQFEE